MSLLGEDGFKKLARLNHEAACRLADELVLIEGLSIENDSFFNEFVVTLPKQSKEVVDDLVTSGIIAGHALDGNRLMVCATEMTTQDNIEEFVHTLSEIL